ncbi:hypothetical protein M1349_05605 [Patescibacteria group bacterium]|nr:hypothetical protein [Patescibacteria group bacterium]
MRKYKDSDIEKAKALRKKKRYSFAKLQKITGIPATTIRNWCQDDFLGTRWDTLLISNQRKRRKIKSSEISSISSIKELDTNNAKVFASLIYWCEGTKYPASNKLEFANSDPLLLKLFTTLLRKAFVLKESKLRVHVQIHDTHDFKKIKNFWSNHLDIPQSQFIKPTVTKPRGGKHRKDYLGTCTVRYYDYRIQLKLIGIYEAFAKKLAVD